MLKRRIGILIMACALFLLPAASPGFRAETQEEGVRLSLEKVLHVALEHNLDLLVARIDPEISEQSVLVQDADFDPGLQSQFSYQEVKREATRVFEQPGISETLTANVGMAQNLRYGADVRLQLESSREIGDSVFFEPFYQSALSLVYNQPLLRGRGKEPTTELLLLAKGNLEISREELRRQADLTIELVEGAYWNVVAAHEGLRIAKLALKRAQDLLDLNRKKVEVGTLAPIEITQAEAEVAANQEGVIVAEVGLQNAEDELRRLMAVPVDDPMWERTLVLTDEPLFEPQDIDLQAALDTALGSRPEMATALRDLRNKELSERVARNALKPGLDLALTATPWGNNNKGQLVDPGPDGQLGTADDIPLFDPATGFPLFDEASYGESLSEIGDLNNYFLNAQLTYSIPIGNRAAKANRKIAELNREKSELALSAQKQTIRVEVRQAVRGVESSVKRVEAARVTVRLQNEKLEAEQRKFENGMSTSFNVLEFQEDLANAELSSVRAVLDYAKALVALERAKGTLLDARGLSLK